MLAVVLAALVAGFVGSPHCVGMCGGLAAACARPRGGAVLWHAGRLSTYAVLGAFAGAFGAAIPGPPWVPGIVSALLLVWFAASLAGFTGRSSPRFPALARLGAMLARRDGPGWRLLFGMATGLLPCGMLYAALSMAVAAASPVSGALALVAFGLATVPALALLSEAVRRLALRSVWHRRVLALAVLLLGLWSVGMRVVPRDRSIRGGMHHGMPAAPDSGRHRAAPAALEPAGHEASPARARVRA